MSLCCVNVSDLLCLQVYPRCPGVRSGSSDKDVIRSSLAASALYFTVQAIGVLCNLCKCVLLIKMSI